MRRGGIIGEIAGGRESENLYSLYPQGTAGGSHVHKRFFKRGICPASIEVVIFVAKDGTARGGARVGAGRKGKALKDKLIEDGRASVMTVPDDVEAVEMPPVKDYMKETQRDGKPLGAEDIYTDTWKWLEKVGCAAFVNPLLIEQYSMTVARWIQCEKAISEFGMIGKHPTTGAPMASPYVSMSRDYQKQINQVWYEIYQIVKENCAGDYTEKSEDPMENLLARRKG